MNTPSHTYHEELYVFISYLEGRVYDLDAYLSGIYDDDEGEYYHLEVERDGLELLLEDLLRLQENGP